MNSGPVTEVQHREKELHFSVGEPMVYVPQWAVCIPESSRRLIITDLDSEKSKKKQKQKKNMKGEFLLV